MVDCLLFSLRSLSYQAIVNFLFKADEITVVPELMHAHCFHWLCTNPTEITERWTLPLYTLEFSICRYIYSLNQFYRQTLKARLLATSRMKNSVVTSIYPGEIFTGCESIWVCTRICTKPYCIYITLFAIHGSYHFQRQVLKAYFNQKSTSWYFNHHIHPIIILKNW